MREKRLTRAMSHSRKSNKVKDRGAGKVETRTDVSKEEETAFGGREGVKLKPKAETLAVLKLRFSCRRRVLIFPRTQNLSRVLDVPLAKTLV